MQKIDTDVGKLVNMIETGELRLPEMQRRYLWTPARVRDLLDSLYRGYPSGVILVWEADREMPTRDLAVSQADNRFQNYKLLLDGQQRLTSLSAILLGKPVVVRGRNKPIHILFNLGHPDGPPLEADDVDENSTDLDHEPSHDRGDQNLQTRLQQHTFVVANHTLKSDPRWVEVSQIFKEEKGDAQILRSLVKSLDDPLFDTYAKRLQALRKIRDYPYVMQVLDRSLKYEEVAEIFVRVNSSATKLLGSDLALAQITSRWQNSLKLFEEFQNECEKKQFTVDLGIVVRTLVAFATGQSRFRTVSTISEIDLKKAWDGVKEGLRFAINE
jgi:uncharacterized protein DUF262